MNPNGANSWIASKKGWLTTVAGIAVSVCTYLAVNDPNPRHQIIYGVAGIILAGLAGNHVQAESKIDAAAVKGSSPETVNIGSVGNTDENHVEDLQNAG